MFDVWCSWQTSHSYGEQSLKASRPRLQGGSLQGGVLKTPYSTPFAKKFPWDFVRCVAETLQCEDRLRLLGIGTVVVDFSRGVGLGPGLGGKFLSTCPRVKDRLAKFLPNPSLVTSSFWLLVEMASYVISLSTKQFSSEVSLLHHGTSG